MGEDISEWLGPRGGLRNGDLAQLRRGLVWEGERLVPGPAGQRGVPSPRVPVSFQEHHLDPETLVLAPGLPLPAL